MKIMKLQIVALHKKIIIKKELNVVNSVLKQHISVKKENNN